MSLFAMFRSAGPTGFGYGSTAEQVTEGLSLAGQTILVTGCNSGIGRRRVGVGEGAATEVFAAVHAKALPLAGSYLSDSNVKNPRADAEDAALATRQWAESEKIVQAL